MSLTATPYAVVPSAYVCSASMRRRSDPARDGEFVFLGTDKRPREAWLPH